MATTEAYTPRPWARTKPRVRGRRGEHKTHCIHGHEFTPENTFRDSRGYRCCYICTAAARQRYRKRKAIEHNRKVSP